MKSDEAGSTVAQPRRKSNTDENTKTLSLGKTFEVSRNEVEHKTVFSYFSVPLGSSSQIASDSGGERNTTDSPLRSVFRMLRQLRSRKGKENKRKKLHNYSFAVRGASTRAGIAAGEGKLKQAEVIMWMVIGWD